MTVRLPYVGIVRSCSPIGNTPLSAYGCSCSAPIITNGSQKNAARGSLAGFTSTAVPSKAWETREVASASIVGAVITFGGLNASPLGRVIAA